MKRIKKFKISYEYIGNKGSPEQKKEFQERLNRAYDMIFQKVLEREKLRITRKDKEKTPSGL